jgi:hypothetical protein
VLPSGQQALQRDPWRSKRRAIRTVARVPCRQSGSKLQAGILATVVPSGSGGPLPARSSKAAWRSGTMPQQRAA